MSGADFNPCTEAKLEQCSAVLDALRKGPKTTAQLRAILGPSSSSAARIMDLRKVHRIVTQREGRQALYVLLPSDGGTV